MKTIWLSFADPDAPKTTQFLGVSIVDIDEEDEKAALASHPTMFDKQKGPTILAAVTKARDMHCNPGGEVRGMELVAPVAPQWKNRLLNVSELRAAGFISPAPGEVEGEE